MAILWSRRFFPKVFGGVFWFCFFCKPVFAESTMEQTALIQAKNAFMEASGINTKLKQTQQRMQNVTFNYIKDLELNNEFVATLALIKIARDKNIKFNYQGNSYLVCPNYIEVKIPF